MDIRYRFRVGRWRRPLLCLIALGPMTLATPRALLAAIASGSKSLKIGHLSLQMMKGKVSNGEWRWIDEAKCVMHTATPKPALLRADGGWATNHPASASSSFYPLRNIPL